MNKEIDKPRFSISFLFATVSFLVGLTIQTCVLYFTQQMAIRDEISNRIADIRVIQTRLDAIEKKLSCNTLPQRAPIQNYWHRPVAILPQELNLEKQKRSKLA